jgi:cytochrome c6
MSTKKLAVAALGILVIIVVAFAAAAQGNLAGAALYKKDCAMCHGPDGTGNSPMGKKLGVRDLKSPEAQKQTDAQLTEVIAKGKNKMPAYGEKLKPAEIKDVVAYIRELKK